MLFCWNNRKLENNCVFICFPWFNNWWFLNWKDLFLTRKEIHLLIVGEMIMLTQMNSCRTWTLTHFLFIESFTRFAYISFILLVVKNLTLLNLFQLGIIFQLEWKENTLAHVEVVLFIQETVFLIIEETFNWSTQRK